MDGFSDISSGSSEVGSEVSEVETPNSDFGDGDGVNDFDDTYEEMNSGNESMDYSNESMEDTSTEGTNENNYENTDTAVESELSDFDDTDETSESTDTQEPESDNVDTENISDMNTDESVDSALADFDDSEETGKEESVDERTGETGDEAESMDDNTDESSEEAEPVDESANETGDETESVDEGTTETGNDAEPVDETELVDETGEEAEPVDESRDESSEEAEPVDESVDETGEEAESVDESSEESGDETEEEVESVDESADGTGDEAEPIAESTDEDGAETEPIAESADETELVDECTDETDNEAESVDESIGEAEGETELTDESADEIDEETESVDGADDEAESIDENTDVATVNVSDIAEDAGNDSESNNVNSEGINQASKNVDGNNSNSEGTGRVDAEKNTFFENASYHQGQNDLGALGTCGPTSIANSLNRVSGTSEYTENKVLHNAMDNNLCHKSDNPYSCGGTTTRDVVNIIDNVKNPESNIHTEVYEYDKALSVDQLADRIDNPSTVAMVGVDSATLWDRRGDVVSSGLFQHTDAPSDHWITVDSPIRDENGSVTGFNVIDSGGGVDYVDRDKFESMYMGDAGHTVSDPTAMLISNEGEVANSHYGGEGIERTSDYKGSAMESDGGDPPSEAEKIEKLSPAEVAQNWQGSELYPGIDKYENITLHDGDKIYILESQYEVDNKCHSGYATTEGAVSSSGYDATKLSEGLQIKPYLDEKAETIPDKASYRTQVTEYTVHGDIEVAWSASTEANPQYGDGGMPQYYVVDIEKKVDSGILTRGQSIELSNSEVSSSDYYKMVNSARTKYSGGY